MKFLRILIELEEYEKAEEVLKNEISYQKDFSERKLSIFSLCVMDLMFVYMLKNDNQSIENSKDLLKRSNVREFKTLSSF